METTNDLITTPAAAGGASCHASGRGSDGWLGRRRSLVIAGAVIAAGATTVALSQHWLAAADLVLLVFVLPCAAMMFMCMKGKDGQQTDTTQASARPETPAATDIRNQPSS